jgi:hypothetical protein
MSTPIKPRDFIQNNISLPSLSPDLYSKTLDPRVTPEMLEKWLQEGNNGKFPQLEGFARAYYNLGEKRGMAAVESRPYRKSVLFGCAERELSKL